MLITQLLERVRTALRGPRSPGKHSRAAPPPVPPSPASATCPSTKVRIARAVVIRRPEPWECAGALVRPYVAVLGDPPRKAATGVPADPWRDGPVGCQETAEADLRGADRLWGAHRLSRTGGGTP